jgi:hypothetical protein
MSDSPARTEFPPYRCRDCGSEVGFRSRRRTLAERFVLPLFLLQPVRCGECFRRDYRLIFTPVRERLSEAIPITPAKPITPANRSVTSDRNVA